MGLGFRLCFTAVRRRLRGWVHNHHLFFGHLFPGGLDSPRQCYDCWLVWHSGYATRNRGRWLLWFCFLSISLFLWYIGSSRCYRRATLPQGYAMVCLTIFGEEVSVLVLHGFSILLLSARGFAYSFIGPKRESISRFSVSFGVVHHFVRRSQRRFLGWFGSRL